MLIGKAKYYFILENSRSFEKIEHRWQMISLNQRFFKEMSKGFVKALKKLVLDLVIGSTLFICPIQNVMHNKLSDWGNRTFDLPANFCNILSFKCQQNWITFINVIFSHQINCASVINNCQCPSQRLLCHLQLFHNKNEKNITND